jgi:hypothetical protein
MVKNLSDQHDTNMFIKLKVLKEYKDLIKEDPKLKEILAKMDMLGLDHVSKVRELDSWQLISGCNSKLYTERTKTLKDILEVKFDYFKKEKELVDKAFELFKKNLKKEMNAEKYTEVNKKALKPCIDK